MDAQSLPGGALLTTLSAPLIRKFSSGPVNMGQCLPGYPFELDPGVCLWRNLSRLLLFLWCLSPTVRPHQVICQGLLDFWHDYRPHPKKDLPYWKLWEVGGANTQGLSAYTLPPILSGQLPVRSGTSCFLRLIQSIYRSSRVGP